MPNKTRTVEEILCEEHIKRSILHEMIMDVTLPDFLDAKVKAV